MWPHKVLNNDVDDFDDVTDNTGPNTGQVFVRR